MASKTQVKQYFAYWFQLGKRAFIPNQREALHPKLVIAGDRYSSEFEDCWQRLQAPDARDSHLEGTDQTIAELLSPAWEINPCSRCAMPTPLKSVGMSSETCPCVDLPTWPNTELPQPRSPISSQGLLSEICDRLKETSQDQM
jgi:hypothetical protein